MAEVDLSKENALVQTGLQGGNVKLNIGQSRMRAKYWRQDNDGNWVQTGLLPADPLSINQYFAKGFRGKPLEQEIIEVNGVCEKDSSPKKTENKSKRRKKSYGLS